MKLSKAAIKGIDRTPWLKKCFKEYFAPGEFVFDRSHMVAIKWRSDGYYAVMLFNVNGELWIADVAGTYDGNYEVCNDGEICYSTKQWMSVKVDPWCDRFTMSEE